MSRTLKEMQQEESPEDFKEFLIDYNDEIKYYKKLKAKLKILYVKIKEGKIDQSPDGVNDWLGVDTEGNIMYDLANVPNDLIHRRFNLFTTNKEMVGVLYLFPDNLKGKSETFIDDYYEFWYDISSYVKPILTTILKKQ
jgi:hypothetical protein